MSALKNILEEEYSRLLELKSNYLREIEALPKGSISKKKIRNRHYYYLAYRVKDKVKFDYLGKEDAPIVAQMKDSIKRRKDLERKLKQVNRGLKELSKSLGSRQ